MAILVSQNVALQLKPCRSEYGDRAINLVGVGDRCILQVDLGVVLNHVRDRSHTIQDHWNTRLLPIEREHH